jgi:hypothetical protein
MITGKNKKKTFWLKGEKILEDYPRRLKASKYFSTNIF